MMYAGQKGAKHFERCNSDGARAIISSYAYSMLKKKSLEGAFLLSKRRWTACQHMYRRCQDGTGVNAAEPDQDVLTSHNHVHLAYLVRVPVEYSSHSCAYSNSAGVERVREAQSVMLGAGHNCGIPHRRGLTCMAGRLLAHAGHFVSV